MSFEVGDRVVHPAYGVGRVVGLVNKRVLEPEARLYYEVAIDRSTVWVPVEAGGGGGLRPLTPKADMDRYRAVLRGDAAVLSADPRQRRLDLLNRMKVGTFQDVCELVRDLTARAWQKSLNEADGSVLRKARESLCQEWAAVAEMSLVDASAEVDALLLQARQTNGF